MDKLIGKTVNDRYILTEVVGVGGMAVVYKAFDKVVNRVVAVKVLKEEFMSDAQFRRRFANESKAITMLSQNNIVDVYDVCLDGDMMYMVMEYIDGVTLKEYLDKVGVLDWKEAVFYIKQILKAMSHAHERGIVHRDLKPHNIMLLRDGTIKVTDFGIAKLSKFETQTITDKAIGSVHYISPEQASGDRTDEKTDIYAVGVMLYEMITGTLPFVADSAVSVALMQVQAQPRLPREIVDTIPEGIEEITIKAMMKDPELRYASASAMFNDILKVEADPSTVFGYLNMPAPDSDEAGYAEDNSPTRFIDINDASGEFSGDEEQESEQADGEESDVTENKFKEIWLPIICGAGSALLLLALIVGCIIGFPEIKAAITGSNKKVEMITLSSYIGKDYETVEKENASGLVFQRENKLSSEPKGTIIAQEPEAGTQVAKGSIITFTVSIGVETVQIPDITNKYYELAVQELYDLGINARTKFVSSDSVKENYVIRTDPEKFTEIKQSDTVTVYISSGSEIVTVSVPDVLKRTEDDAVAKLAEQGLRADKAYEYSDTVAEGCVISQSPSAGDRVDEGSSVKIVISRGPAEQTETPPDENPDENPGESTNTPDDSEDNPDDNPEGGDDNPPSGGDTPGEGGNPNGGVELPDDTTVTVPFTISENLRDVAGEGDVRIQISTDNNSWSNNVTLTHDQMEQANYVYSDSKNLPRGTSVSLYVNNSLYKTYTVG